MLRVLGLLAVALVLASAMNACSSNSADGDGESHFLGLCTSHCASGLDCRCGVCTKACDDNAACAALGAGATCLSAATCAESSGRTCGVSCVTNADCGGFGASECRSGACAVPRTTDGGFCDSAQCRQHPPTSSCAERVATYCATAGCALSLPTGPRAFCGIVRFNGSVTVDHGGGYSRATFPAGKDGSLSYVYEDATGALVAVVRQGSAGASCVAGPTSGPPTFTPGISEIVDCSSDAGSTLPTPDSGSTSPHTDASFVGSAEGGDAGSSWFLGDGGIGCPRVDWKHSVEPSYTYGISTCGDWYFVVSETGVVCSTSGSWTGATLVSEDLKRLVVRADVLDTFGKGPIHFGKDSPEAETITIRGKSVTLGAPCGGAAGCVDAPPGVSDLSVFLGLVEEQHRASVVDNCVPSYGCYLPQDPGSCAGNLGRFSYDAATGTCHPFVYGGCGGNENRFATQRDCEIACAFDPCLLGQPIAGDGGGGVVVEGRLFSDAHAACACGCRAAGRQPLCSDADGTFGLVTCF